MDENLVRACFENLKRDISALYSQNSKADANGQINMTPVLRQCAKLEYALNGDIDQIIIMDNEDRKIARIRGDKIIEDFANNVSTLGAAPAMAKYAAGEREKKSIMLKMALARGRVEGAQQLLDELKAEQEALGNSRHE
jgi:hypothetical protein